MTGATGLLLLLCIVLALPAGVLADGPKWLWNSPLGRSGATDEVYFRHVFKLEEVPARAMMMATCDNVMTVWINGREVAASDTWQSPVRRDVKDILRKGDNIIAVHARNAGGGHAGFIFNMDMQTGDQTSVIASNATWRMTASSPEGDAWRAVDFNDSDWVPALEIVAHGGGPWGNVAARGAGEEGGGPSATTEGRIATLPGFEVQLLYSPPRNQQGSWVVLATDPQGRLIASDQGDKGLYRVELDHSQDPPAVNVEKIPVDLSGAQGLTWAFDHLYVHINNGGLFRVKDSNGDDRLDTVENLGGPRRGGEHGNHAVKPTADGQGLYVNAGNFTPVPQLASSTMPTNWGEDLLLPRQWDARGHARGVLAPGGWIARINPDATEWRMISIGYRNHYDIALNSHDELFTWDSDMEWDMGMPWYRPTRLTHAVSGSDFGWRSGSGKWPDYYEDSLPPLIDVGPASPTGLVSGAGAAFPSRFQNALFALDWTFGTMYAVHLTPSGGSYTAELEEFLSGSPLALTSAVIGKDGAMYFVTGGRNTQSGLYRVVYRGDESIEPAPAPDSPEARAARELRRSLEAFHGKEDRAALSAAWPHLASEDRFIRHAARLAIEAQPVENWANQALRDPRPQARATAAVALARMGDESHRPQLLKALLEIDPSTISAETNLGILRALALAFIRLGDATAEERQMVADHLAPQLPNGDHRIDTELVRLLVYLQDGRVIEPAMALMLEGEREPAPDWGDLIQRNSNYGGTIRRMLENYPPTRAINYAFMLRNLRFGWTLEQRRAYYEFIIQAATYPGGNSYTGFLNKTREEALENTSEAMRVALADVTGETLGSAMEFEIKAPQGPGRVWTVDEATRVVEGHLTGRDFEAGRNFYFATSCAACHRFDGFGGDIGPDLSSVRNKFSIAEVLEAIIEPSAAISDQYGSYQIKLKNGQTLFGLVVDREDEYMIHTAVIGAEPVMVAKDDVESIEQVQVSQMPPGLINTLNENELRDLMAYLMSAGDPDSPMFKD